MGYTIGNNYTAAEIKGYPVLASGPTRISSVNPWVMGTPADIVPEGTILNDFSLLALTAFIDRLGTTDTRLEGVFNIYDDGVLIISLPFDWYIDSALGHLMEQVIPIIPPVKVAANSQIRVAIASSVGNLTFGGFKIQYVEALDTYTTDLIKCYPYLATGVSPVSSASAWNWGSWLELVPVNTITSDFDICAINWLDPVAEGTILDTTYQGVIQIGTGAQDSEVSIISVPITFRIDTKAEHVPCKQICTFPIPRRVAANTRVAVRVTDSLAGVLTWGPVKIRYVEIPYTGPQTISNAGAIVSSEAFGTGKLIIYLAPSSITSLEAFGVPKANLNLTPSGIASAEAFGSAKLVLYLLPSAIPSQETFGTPTVSTGAQFLQPPSIVSEEAFGSPKLNLSIIPTGITSQEVFGSPKLNLSVAPEGITSQEIFGLPKLNLVVLPGGIGSLETFGSPKVNLTLLPDGIVSEEVFGLLKLIVSVSPQAIASLESFGVPVVGAAGAKGEGFLTQIV